MKTGTFYNLRSRQTITMTEDDFFEFTASLRSPLILNERYAHYWVCVRIIEDEAPIDLLDEMKDIIEENKNLISVKNIKTGDTFSFIDPTDFINEYKLNKSFVTKLIEGKIKNYKNWQLF